MAWIAGNVDPFAGDTNQQHESHTQLGAATTVSPPAWDPSDYNPAWLAWVGDPRGMYTTPTTVSTGYCWGSQIKVPVACTVSTVWWVNGPAAAGLTLGKVGLYSISGTTGTLLTSGDATTGFAKTTSQGFATATLATPQKLTKGLYAVALCFVGTTGPQVRYAVSAFNIGTCQPSTGGTGFITTGNADIPNTVDLTLNNASGHIWFALS